MARYIPGPAGHSYSVDAGNEHEASFSGEKGKLVNSFEQVTVSFMPCYQFPSVTLQYIVLLIRGLG